MQSQVVCSGCRILLMYPSGATNVCCALCKSVTTIPPPGIEMAQLICGGCRTLLIHTCGATSVRCSCCHTVNLAPGKKIMGKLYFSWSVVTVSLFDSFDILAVQDIVDSLAKISLLSFYLALGTLTQSPNIAHINCGNCHTTLMYPYGAPSVKCAVCQYITNVDMGNVRVPLPMHRPVGPASMPSCSAPLSNSQSQTVVVENPMSVDKSGKLVSNVVVGITTDKK